MIRIYFKKYYVKVIKFKLVKKIKNSLSECVSRTQHIRE